MSAREPKSRLLVREGMADHEWMTSFTAAEREWYLLTALFTDDSGYLDWSLPGNAADVYRYEAPKVRERRVMAFARRFAESGRLDILSCGVHAFMPRVAARPRGQRREYAVRDAHHKRCSPAQSESKPIDGQDRDSPVQSVPVHSIPLRGRADVSKDNKGPTKMSGLREAMAAAGLRSDIGGKD